MTGTYLEGVSDEVLITFTSVFLLVSFITMLSRSRRTEQTIHSSSTEAVEAARAELPADRPSFRTGENDVCPVCLEGLRFSTETNCGHVYCASCLISYWHHGNWLGAMNCPVCRQQVTVLIPTFTHEEEVSDQCQELKGEIRGYNRRYSGEPRPIMDYIYDFPVLIRHLFRGLFSVDGLVFVFRFRMFLYLGLVVVYFLSPLDIIPEAVTGVLGLVDDVVIAVAVLVYLTVIYRQNIAELY